MKTNLLKHSTILWADDDPDELSLMREVLQELNSEHPIVEATNGREVLNYLEGAKQNGVFPCLVVLDLNMPVLNGKETLIRLKQDALFRHIPTVVLTTSSSPFDQQFCERYETEMLTKPITFAALKQVTEKLLHKCEASVSEQ